MKEGVNESSLKRRRQHDLPTPESPMSNSLICRQSMSETNAMDRIGRWVTGYILGSRSSLCPP